MKIFRSLFLVSGLFLATATSAQAAPFDKLVGVAPVLVLTGSVDNPLYIDEIDALTAGLSDLKSRNFVVIHFKDKYLDTLEELSAVQYRPYRMERATQADFLEQELQTDDDIFSVVLVGEDGNVEHVWSGAVIKPAEIIKFMDSYVPPAPLPKPGTIEDKDKMHLNSMKLNEMKMQNHDELAH